MPKLFIHLLDADFHSLDDGADYARPEEAMAIGVRGALGILADDIYAGRSNAAVDVSVEREDGTPLLRSAIALSVSSLTLCPRPEIDFSAD